MTKYEIILYWSDEDGAFIAEVPELPAVQLDGATRQEALANAETVIRSGSSRSGSGRPSTRAKRAVVVRMSGVRRRPASRTSSARVRRIAR